MRHHRQSVFLRKWINFLLNRLLDGFEGSRAFSRHSKHLSAGTGVGAIAGGAATGALVGTVVGPVGTAVGAAVGAVVGGLAGKGVAEAIDPTAEEAYWHDNFENRSYVNKGDTFEDFGPAYRYGWDSYGHSEGRTFDQAEADLKRDWERNKGSSSLTWDRARLASRDSWQRTSNAIERAVPGDSDRDGM